MTDTTTDAGEEDLSGMPMARAIDKLMKFGLETGAAPADVLEQAFAAVASFAIDLEGIEKTAARLLIMADQLASLKKPDDVRAN